MEVCERLSPRGVVTTNEKNGHPVDTLAHTPLRHSGNNSTTTSSKNKAILQQHPLTHLPSCPPCGLREKVGKGRTAGEPVKMPFLGACVGLYVCVCVCDGCVGVCGCICVCLSRLIYRCVSEHPPTYLLSLLTPALAQSAHTHIDPDPPVRCPINASMKKPSQSHSSCVRGEKERGSTDNIHAYKHPSPEAYAHTRTRAGSLRPQRSRTCVCV